MALTRDQVKLASLPKEAIEVAELGGEVIVRGMTLSDRLELFSGINETGRRFVQIPRLLARSVVDPSGNPLLTEEEWEAFGGIHLEASMKLFDAVRRVSGLDTEAIEKN